MSRIIFQESYIVIIPSYGKTEMHKHPMQHLFFGEYSCNVSADGKEIQGNIIFLDSNVKHVVEEGNGCDFFILIDPTSIIAEQLRERFGNNSFCAENFHRPVNQHEKLADLQEDEVIYAAESVLLALGVNRNQTSSKDARIEQVVSNLISGEWLNYSVKKISRAAYLSESRLTHLFKEQTGVSLKSYILMRKMERAYKFVNSGGKITQAAQEAGFSSSAHLAYTCKMLTGISISDVLRSIRKPLKKADF